MSIARFYVDGESWEIMGNVADSFLPYTNSLEASRSGRVYATTETKVKTLKVDEIKAEPDEFQAIADFLSNCASKRFACTVVFDEDCGEGFTEYHYTNCLLSGEPEFSIFEKKISGFEVGYEQRIPNTAVV